MPNPADLTIRHVAPKDFKAWLPLWNGYNAFYGRSGKTALPLDITKVTWSRFFDAYEPVHALVAENAGSLIGLAHYLIHRNTISITPSCYMQDLFTSEAARGKGVGRALIEEVYKQADILGIKRVYWHTQEDNTIAMHLYDAIADKPGFVVYSKRL